MLTILKTQRILLIKYDKLAKTQGFSMWISRVPEKLQK